MSGHATPKQEGFRRKTGWNSRQAAQRAGWTRGHGAPKLVGDGLGSRTAVTVIFRHSAVSNGTPRCTNVQFVDKTTPQTFEQRSGVFFIVFFFLSDASRALKPLRGSFMPQGCLGTILQFRGTIQAALGADSFGRFNQQCFWLALNIVVKQLK